MKYCLRVCCLTVDCFPRWNSAVTYFLPLWRRSELSQLSQSRWIRNGSRPWNQSRLRSKRTTLRWEWHINRLVDEYHCERIWRKGRMFCRSVWEFYHQSTPLSWTVSDERHPMGQTSIWMANLLRVRISLTTAVSEYYFHWEVDWFRLRGMHGRRRVQSYRRKRGNKWNRNSLVLIWVRNNYSLYRSRGHGAPRRVQKHYWFKYWRILIGNNMFYWSWLLVLVRLELWGRYRTVLNLRKLSNVIKRVRWTSRTNALCGEMQNWLMKIRSIARLSWGIEKVKVRKSKGGI